MTTQEFRKRIENDGKIAACRSIDLIKGDSEEEANAAILSYSQRLLLAGKKPAAAMLLFGETLFHVKSMASRMVWRGIEDHSKTIVMGGGSVTKSYTGIVWAFLDWLSDPEFTTVKLISTTGGHAKANTFSTLTSLHRNAICPLPGIPYAESISLFETDKRACISIVRIREGEDTSGVLQGFHPLPRPTSHPVFGPLSRVRAVLDEAEDIPTGVWGGVDNLLTAIDDSGSVKIMAFYNPKDITSRTAALAEPVGGWGEFDIELGVRGKNEWASREGWHVVRIDPKRTENVMQRKVIFPGMQTYEGYRALEQQGGGNSLSYFTFGRGAYPPDSAISTVVPQRVLGLMRGEFIFTGRTTKIGAADIAIDGRDEAIFTAGRWGKASAFKRIVFSEDGKSFKWVTIKFPEERDALQLDQQFALAMGSAEIVGKAIKTNCIKLGIDPEWMMLDATGNGSPVWNYLKIPEVWSPKVKGIDFSKPATELKILEQDSKKAIEEYDGINTEVWFALSRWGEYGYFAISPNVRSENLERELLARRYVLGKGKTLKVEKKDINNRRLGRSPDHADSATILVHCARTGGATGDGGGGVVLPSMTGISERDESGPESFAGPADRVEWFVPSDIFDWIEDYEIAA